MNSTEILTIFSLFNLGFFGGFSHCIGMCGPFVLTQTANKLQNVPLESYSGFKKLQNLALLPYHLGRITTYSLIGFLCSFLTGNLIDLGIFKNIAAMLLFVASMLFFSLFLKRIAIVRNFWCKFLTTSKIYLKKWLIKPYSARLSAITLKTPKITNKTVKRNILLQKLFANPVGFNGYLLGLILGFIPCGLLYGAFVLASSIKSPAIAALGMMAFGAATFPALFISAISGGFFFCKIIKPKLELAANLMLFINAIMLLLMACDLLSS